MPIKKCEMCGNEFSARLSRIRTCSHICRNNLIARDKLAKNTIEKSCVVCGNNFTLIGSESKKVTCSESCAYQLRGIKQMDRVEKVCETCGKAYQVTKGVVDSRYCSKQCLYERNVKHTKRKCVVCEKEFTSPPSHMHVLTCSTECGYKNRQVWNEKEKVELECRQCGNKFYEHDSHADRRVYCSLSCMQESAQLKATRSANASGDKNPSWNGGISSIVVSKTGIEYRRRQGHVENEKSTRRKRVMFGATPAWSDSCKILAFYEVSKNLSLMTGIQHHVDHIVPLTSDIVCGLHCEFNLQVIPAVDNLKKHNRHWPNMP